MDLVNKDFVRLSKTDILVMLANEDKVINDDLTKILKAILKYENGKTFISDIYVNKNSVYLSNVINKYGLIIKRQTLANALIYAMCEDNMDVANQIKKDINVEYVEAEQLGDTLSYVLEHSLDINEVFGNEKSRLIFDDQKQELIESTFTNYSKENSDIKR